MVHVNDDERFVFLDLGTSGLGKRPTIRHIAAIAVSRGLRELESFDEVVTSSNAVNVAKRFGWFLRRHGTVSLHCHDGRYRPLAQLVSYNATRSDGPWLRAWFERKGVFMPASYRVLCMLQRVMWHFEENKTLTPPPDYRLGTICSYFGIALERPHYTPHDVRATLELYRTLVDRNSNDSLDRADGLRVGYR